MSSPPAEAGPSRTNSWRASHNIRERMLRVAGLRQRGLGPANIAAQLDVSRSTVSRDLRRLDLLWRQEYTHLANAERLRSLATLRESERVCWFLINRYQDDADHLAGVTAAARTLLAVQREIRQLLGPVPIPSREHFWGYRHEGSYLLLPFKDTPEPNPDRILYPGDLDRDFAALLEAERRGDAETLTDPDPEPHAPQPTPPPAAPPNPDPGARDGHSRHADDLHPGDPLQPEADRLLPPE